MLMCRDEPRATYLQNWGPLGCDYSNLLSLKNKKPIQNVTRVKLRAGLNFRLELITKVTLVAYISGK